MLCRSALAGREAAVLDEGEALAAAVARMPAGDRRYTALVPTQLRRFLDAEPDALRSFDAVLVGGAATDPALLARARADGVAGRDHLRDDRDRRRLRLRRRARWTASASRVDRRGLELAGPMLASGYRLDPEATAAAFDGGWFRTRDAGQLDDDGPAHRARPARRRRRSAAASTWRPRRWRRRCASTRASPTPSSSAGRTRSGGSASSPPSSRARRRAPDLAELRRWVGDRLGSPAAPRQLHVLAAVPTLHTGKPDRRAVAAPSPEA